MKIEKISFKRFIKVVFGTLGIISLLGLLFLIGVFIKISFINGSSLDYNIYALKSGINYYFDQKTKNFYNCEDLTQDDVTILNEKLKIYGYSGNRDYWCDLGKIRINNKVDTIYNEYVNKDFKIPKEIYKLQNLYLLRITSLNTAEISDFENISNLTNLVDLSIDINEGNFKIPEEIYNIKTIKYLSIYGKGFSGNLSDKINNLESLKKLTIRNTNIGGNFPDNLFKINNLQEILVIDNNFSGDVSILLDNLGKLDFYYISKNNFSGNFPGYISELKTFKE